MMLYKFLTPDHQKQMDIAKQVMEKYYTPEERLECIGTIAEKDAPEGINYIQFFLQLADHNSLHLKKGDRYSDIDGSIITDCITGNRVQSLVEYKYDTGNISKIIEKFENSNQFEHYKLLIERDSTSTLKMILAVHKSNELKFKLDRSDFDKSAIIVKAYEKSSEGKIVSVDKYNGKTVEEFKEIRRTEV